MTTFPPAPSWYMPQILKASSNGRIAYGSRNVLVVVTPMADKTSSDSQSDHGLKADSSGENWRSSCETNDQSSLVVPHPHAAMLNIGNDKSRITSVAWSVDGNQIATGLDDGYVQLVNVQGWAETSVLTWTLLNSCHKEASRLKPKVNSVCWSAVKTDQVISGDESGVLVVWDVTGNSARVLPNFIKQTIFILEAHPYKADVVAVGCKLGFVMIASIEGSGKILHKIRAHIEDIQGLSWSPSKERDVLLDESDVNDGKPEVESLLAVASRDRTLTVWSSQSGKQVAALVLQKSSDKSKSKGDLKQSTWITCLWMSSKTILSSGVSGELFEWNLEKIAKKSTAGIFFIEELKLVHKEHSRTLFSITNHGSVVFTVGQDRSVVAFDLAANSVRFNLPAFAAGVYAIASNVLDPSILAIGAGDGNIRIWKMNSTKSTFDCSMIWNKLNATKVTALAWHPDKDNILALATDDGRVGTVDALAQRSSPIFYDLKHRSTVYVVCWGPPAVALSSEKSSKDFFSAKKVLYSCADNAVYMHSDFQKSVNIDSIIGAASNESPTKERRASKRTDVAFQPHHFRFMSLGCEDGSVEILSMPHLEPLCILKSFHKLIQSVAWHPYYIGGSSDASEYHNFVAVASNEFDIHVWDLSNALKGDAQEVEVPDAVNVLTTPKQILKGHQSRVIYLAWSPLENGKLLSVSYDSTAQVWDAINEVPIANFSGHSGRLYSGLWNPINPDMIFTGGEDLTLFGWNISKQRNKLPPHKSGKAIPAVKKAKETSLEDLTGEATEARRRKISDKKKKSSITSDDDDSSGVEMAVIDKRDTKSTLMKQRQKKKLLFSVTARYEKNAFTNDGSAADATSALLKSYSEGQSFSIDKFPDLAFFSDKISLDARLADEACSLLSQGQYEWAGYLRAFTGDYGVAVREAIKASKLTDWHIGLAQAASRELYIEACQAYADQLVKEDDILKASTYLLMAGKVLEAIDLLQKNELHCAALAIAKSRLPDDCDVIRSVYLSWANHSIQHGQFALAARCFIAANDFSRASTMLAKLPNPDSTRMAVLLAKKAGNEETARILAIQCGAKCLETRYWKCLDQLSEICNYDEVKKFQEKALELRLNVGNGGESLIVSNEP